MLYPRLASLAILLASSALAAFVGPQVFSAREMPHGFIGLLVYFGILLPSIFGPIAGVGGLVASFGMERVGPACFRARDTRLGRLVVWVGAENFCAVSWLCGLVLSVATLLLFSLAFLDIVLLISSPLSGVLGIACEAGVALLIWGVSKLAERYPRVFGIGFIVAVFGILMATGIYVVITGAPVRGLSLDDLWALAVGLILGIGCIAIAWLVKHLPFYRAICPVSEPTEPATE